MAEKLFQKYYARVAREAIVKSVLSGLICGCAAMLLVSFLTWFFGFKAGLFLALALFLVTTAGTAALFYFKKFRPSTKDIARKIDALGLEERLITMAELENDDSYIAMRQREDALEALGKVDQSLIKIVVSAALIAAVCVATVIGLIGGTTVSSLYFAEAIPSGMQLVSKEYILGEFTVDYTIERGGPGAVYYLGDNWMDLVPFEEAVTVTEGEDAPAVIAVPDDGFMFAGWSDGETSPVRHDLNVKSDITATPRFVQYTLGDPLNDDFFNMPGGDEDFDDDAEDEFKYLTGSEVDLPEDGGAWEPMDPEEDFDPPRDDSNKQTENGDKYYGDGFGDAKQDSDDRTNGNNDYSDGQKGSLDDYWSGLNPGERNTGDEGGN